MSAQTGLLAAGICVLCAVLIGVLAFLMARFERALLGPNPPQASALRNLLLSLGLAIALGLVGTSLAGGMHPFVFGLAFYAGLCFWLWLESAGGGAERNRGRDGASRPAPRPRGRAPRRVG